MNASPDAQRLLLDLADLDRRLAQAEHDRTNVPQAARIKELASLRTAQQHELATLAGSRDDLAAEIGRVEQDVAACRARQQRDARLLEGANDSKSTVGLQHELETLGRRLTELEDQELEVMQRLEDAEKAFATQQELIAQTTEEGTRLTAEAKDLVAQANRLAEQLGRDRAAVAATVPDPLLAAYTRIASRGSGAALIRRGTCEACRMVLGAADLAEIRQAPADLVVNCPECGCILVRTEESGL